MTRTMKLAVKIATVSTLALLAGCGGTVTQDVQNAALVTCSGEAAAVTVLAGLKAAGKLSDSQIAAIDMDITLVDPVCSNSNPDTVLTNAAETAAQDLITLAGSIH